MSKNYFDKTAYFGGKTSGYKLGYKLLDSRTRWKPIIKEIIKLKSVGNILDLGCAYGFFLKYLPNSFRKYGIEISECASFYAKKNNPKSYISSGDFLEKNFQKKKFDVITSFEVFEHLPLLEKAINKIHILLKDDGILIASFPVVKSFLERKWFTQFDESHINQSEKVLGEVNKKFNIIKTKFTFDCFRFILISKYRLFPVHQSYFIVAVKK